MKYLALGAAALMMLTLPAVAANLVAVPLPVAGVVGPVGLAGVAAGYAVLKGIQRFRRTR